MARMGEGVPRMAVAHGSIVRTVASATRNALSMGTVVLTIPACARGALTTIAQAPRESTSMAMDALI